MFYDVHCHLTDKKFDKDREELIKQCSEKNITIIVNGLDYKDNIKVLEFSEKFTNVFASIGMYPLYEFDNRFLNQVMNNKNNIIALGEVGLDFSKGFSEEQVVNFKRIISLAEDLNLPLIVHSRKAQTKVLELIKDVKVPLILHYFEASKKLIKKALELDNVFFTVSSSAVYNDNVKMLINLVPINRLVCETDSPVLWKGERNTPLNIKFAYETISEIKNISVEEVEGLVEKTINDLFF